MQGHGEVDQERFKTGSPGTEHVDAIHRRQFLTLIIRMYLLKLFLAGITT